MCFACARLVFVLQGGEDGRGTDGGGGRTKTHLTRPKHNLKSCTEDHLHTSISRNFQPLCQFLPENSNFKPVSSRRMILPTRYVSLRNVGRRNESTISCEISAFANFDPLKLVFSPVFYIFWKILVPFTKFDLIVVFKKCV